MFYKISTFVFSMRQGQSILSRNRILVVSILIATLVSGPFITRGTSSVSSGFALLDNSAGFSKTGFQLVGEEKLNEERGEENVDNDNDSEAQTIDLGWAMVEPVLILSRIAFPIHPSTVFHQRGHTILPLYITGRTLLI